MRIGGQASLKGILSGVQLAQFPVGDTGIEQRLVPIFALPQAGIESLGGGAIVAQAEAQAAQAETGVFGVGRLLNHARVEFFGLFRILILLERERQVPERG